MKMQNIKVISPAPRDLWESILGNQSDVMIFAIPAWMDAVTEATGLIDASRYYEFPGGGQAILPLVKSRGKVEWLSVLASMPHGWGLGGVVSNSKLGMRELRLILDDLKNLNAARVNIRVNPLDDALWKQQENVFDAYVEHTTHILDISEGFDHFWTKILDSATRNKIRKGEKNGLAVECGQSENSVTDFYQTYLRWTDYRATKTYIPRSILRWLAVRREPLDKFMAVKRNLGEKCQIWVGKQDGIPIASAVLLIHGSHAHYWRSFSDRSLAGPTRINELLQKHMIEEACRQGCTFYHMGESGETPSLIHFKEKFGAKRYSSREYFFENLPISSIDRTLGHLSKRLETACHRINLRHDYGKRH